MSVRKTIIFAVALTAWATCLVGGLAALAHYDATAGPARALTPNGAKFLAQHEHHGRGLLVMAVHPLCPCAGASLGELGDLLARSHGTCDAIIVQYEPAQPSSDWPMATDHLQLGGQRVPVLVDPRGELADALGAETSGHAIFADATGAIRFQGGLTLARAHRGRSPAQDAILGILQGSHPMLTQAPVFGCSLKGECSADPSS